MVAVALLLAHRALGVEAGRTDPVRHGGGRVPEEVEPIRAHPGALGAEDVVVRRAGVLAVGVLGRGVDGIVRNTGRQAMLSEGH